MCFHNSATGGFVNLQSEKNLGNNLVSPSTSMQRLWLHHSSRRGGRGWEQLWKWKKNKQTTTPTWLQRNWRLLLCVRFAGKVSHVPYCHKQTRQKLLSWVGPPWPNSGSSPAVWCGEQNEAEQLKSASRASHCDIKASCSAQALVPFNEKGKLPVLRPWQSGTSRTRNRLACHVCNLISFNAVLKTKVYSNWTCSFSATSLLWLGIFLIDGTVVHFLSHVHNQARSPAGIQTCYFYLLSICEHNFRGMFKTN